jgi:hypothetical protein
MKPKTARAFALEQTRQAKSRGLRLAKGAAAALRSAGVRVEELETTTHPVRREHAPDAWKAGPKVGDSRRTRNVHRFLRATANRERPDLVMVPWRQAWADCLAVSAATLTNGLRLRPQARGALIRRLLDEPEFARALDAAVLLGGKEAGEAFLRASVPPWVCGRRRKP